jgi:hypothetical protein
MNITVYFMNICWNKLKGLVTSSVEASVVIGWVDQIASLNENGKSRPHQGLIL